MISRRTMARIVPVEAGGHRIPASRTVPRGHRPLVGTMYPACISDALPMHPRYIHAGIGYASPPGHAPAEAYTATRAQMRLPGSHGPPTEPADSAQPARRGRVLPGVGHAARPPLPRAFTLSNAIRRGPGAPAG